MEVGNNGIITIRWNVKPIDYSHDKEDSIKELVSKKYNIPASNVRVEPVYIKSNVVDNDSMSFEDIQDIQDPKFQQKLFFDYLKEYDITDYDENMLLDIDSQINSRIDFSEFTKCRRYDINYIKWGNFLCYGPDNYFDFSKLKGLVLLSGKPANQSGKSTFAYDLIHFALHGKTPSGKVDVLANYFNYNLPEATEVNVETSLKIDGEDYIIRRKLVRPELGKKNRNKVTQTTEYFKVVDGEEIELCDDENLNGETTAQTNKIIKEAIGDEKDFDMVVCANSKNLMDLISMKDTERGRLMSRWIGLTPIDEKEKIAKDIWLHSVNVGLKSSVYNKDIVKGEIDVLQKMNEDYSKSISQKEEIVKGSEDKLTKYHEENEKLYLSMKNIDNSLTNVDIVTVEKSIADTINLGNIKKNQIESKQNRLKEIGDIDFNLNDYNEKNEKKFKLSSDIANLKYDIKSLKKANEDLANGEYCPTCKRKLDNVNNEPLIAENKKLIEEKINEGIKAKSEFDSLTNELLSMEANRELKNEKDKLELQVVALNAEKDNLLALWREKTRLKKDYQNNIEAISYNNDITTKINIVKENIKVEETIRFNALNDISSCKKEIDINNGIIKEKESLIETILAEEKLIKNWKIYLMLIGKNGISKMVLRKALPVINNELDRLLDGVADFKIEVAIDDSNDVAFYLVRNNIKVSLATGSGFEQTAAALALRVILGNMSTLSKPPFILLDEILGCVSKENYNNMKKLYDRIVPNYSYVFQISHINDIVNWHDMTLTVAKDENGVSRIIL